MKTNPKFRVGQRVYVHKKCQHANASWISRYMDKTVGNIGNIIEADDSYNIPIYRIQFNNEEIIPKDYDNFWFSEEALLDLPVAETIIKF